MNNQEEWKQIPGWEGFYSVSNFGRIKSHERIINEKRPAYWKPKQYSINEMILNPTKQLSGHLRVSLSKDSKIKYRMVHQLVLQSFIGEKPQGTECCHIDGNPENNRLNNLYYGTRSQNIADAKRHGTFPMGKNRPGAKLIVEQVVEIYSLCKKGLSDAAIANKFNVGKGCIVQIRLGHNWKEITGGNAISRKLMQETF